MSILQQSSEFVQLTPAEVASLPSILVQRFPKAAQFYNIVQICLKNQQNFNFFRYTGLEKDLTLYASRIITETKTYWSLLAPIYVTEEKLAKIMSQFFQLVDWDRKISFNAVDNTIFEHISEASRKVEGYETSFTKGGVYTMPIDASLRMDLSLPKDSEIRRLGSVDMEIVFENWIHAGDNELDFIQEGALNLNSAGLFINGKLVSWGINCWDGGIHVVHTVDEYRGRGYAKILMRHLCWNTGATLGHFPVVHVVDGNVTSLKLMKSLGFEFSHSCTWIECA